VIGDVNRALCGLLTPLLPAACEVRFGAPVPPIRGAGPDDQALVLFLTDVREDAEAGGTEWVDVRDDDGTLLGRRPPIRRFELHYLVTAWAADADAEADLLDAVLAAVDPGRRLDPALLSDTFAGAPVVLRLVGDAAAAYTRLGLPARTVVALVANAPLVLPIDTDLAAPADNITLDMGGPRRGGTIGPATASPAPRRQWRGARIVEE
jgi:hypothetical protein